MQLEALTSSGPRITRQLQQQMAPLAPIQGHAHKPADEEMLEAAELFLKRAHGDQGPAERGKRSRTEGWGAALPTPTASEGEGDALLQPDASKGEGDALLPPTAPEGWGDVLLPPSAASAGEGDALLPPTASEGEGDALLPPTAPEGWGDVLPSSAAFEGEGAHSQHPGVSYNVSKSKWEAYCYQGRIKISFGMFCEFHDAVLAYNDCIRIYCMDVPGGLGEVSSTPVMGIARWQTMALSELARVKHESVSGGRLKVVHCNADGEHYQQLFRGTAEAPRSLIDLHSAALQSSKDLVEKRIAEAGGDKHMAAEALWVDLSESYAAVPVPLAAQFPSISGFCHRNVQHVYFNPAGKEQSSCMDMLPAGVDIMAAVARSGGGGGAQPAGRVPAEAAAKIPSKIKAPPACKGCDKCVDPTAKKPHCRLRAAYTALLKSGDQGGGNIIIESAEEYGVPADGLAFLREVGLPVRWWWHPLLCVPVSIAL